MIIGFWNLKMWKQAAIISLLALCSAAQERRIESILNPGCANCTSKSVTLFHVTAEGRRDTVHQLWDFTGGKPTIIFAITDLNVTLDVDWVNMMPYSFTFSEKPKYSFGVVLNKLWEFNDTNDNARFDPALKNISMDTRFLEWEREEIAQMENEAMIIMVAHGFRRHHVNKSGDIRMKLDLLPFTDYATDLPHLIHSSNSTQVDLIIDNFSTEKSFKSPRFALELVIVSTDHQSDAIKLNMRKGLDDEHTPGIFEIIELITPETEWNKDGGFIQYRPVMYTDSDRDVTNSTEVQTGLPMHMNMPNNTTISRFFNNLDSTKLLVENVCITLGGRGDGFYNKTNYGSWSFSVGYGSPPVEQFSLFVIMVISLGLGIPVLLLTIGFLYIIIKKRRAVVNRPERLSDQN